MMLQLALILALIPPPGPVASSSPAGTTQASPGPSSSPRVLKTIVTVKSSPYCNALADHFNGALVPMLANDRVFAVVDVQLQDFNTLFNKPDYVNRFVDMRNKMEKQTATLQESLRPIQEQIDALHQSASLTTDPAEAKSMTDAANELQDAYKHQFQLSTDLWNFTRNMMDYNIMRHPQPLGGFNPYENTLPAEEKNIKVYLHYDKQLTSIDSAEGQAVDTATTAAETHCASASPQPK
jgi:hypothetical protein